MNKLIKNLALLIPPVKQRYNDLEQLRKENESMRTQNEQLNLISAELEPLKNENQTLRCDNDILNQQLNLKTYLLDQLDKQHERVVMAAWGEDEINAYTCIRPFERVRVTSTGDVFNCCNNWLKQGNSEYASGNIFSQSFDEIWNSEKAKKLRYCASNGNFEYCNDSCGKLRNPEAFPDVMLPRKTAGYHYSKWQDCVLNESPKHIALMLDRTCNLSCIMCRNKVAGISEHERERMDYILENFVRPALKNCETLTFDGTGEFLASKSYVKFLKTISKKEYPSLTRITFQTNALLFTTERWGGFANLDDIDIRLSISIDASSKDVYEKIRRGGNWETLCENMEYISRLRNSSNIKHIKLNFTIQKTNAHQMEAFVEQAKAWNADRVHFLRLFSCGTFSPEEFLEQDVFSDNNSLREESKKTLQKLLNDKNDINITMEGLPI